MELKIYNYSTDFEEDVIKNENLFFLNELLVYHRNWLLRYDNIKINYLEGLGFYKITFNNLISYFINNNTQKKHLVNFTELQENHDIIINNENLIFFFDEHIGVEFEVDKIILDIIDWAKLEDSFGNFSKISLDIEDVIEILEKRIAQLELSHKVIYKYFTKDSKIMFFRNFYIHRLFKKIGSEENFNILKSQITANILQISISDLNKIDALESKKYDDEFIKFLYKSLFNN